MDKKALKELMQAVEQIPEPIDLVIELNGTAIMHKIRAELDSLLERDVLIPGIWIGSEVYYSIVKASMDTQWPFKADFNNEKALIFGRRFTVCDQYGKNAITYQP